MLAASLALWTVGWGAAPAAAEDADPGARIDFPRGPVISSSRITGLAGAFTGVAEGIDGVLKNPASLANRPEHATSWLEVDLALDILQTTGDAIDFDADRVRGGRDADFSAVNAGIDFQLDTFAIGMLAAIDVWTGGDAEHGFEAGLVDYIFAVAQAFGGGEVIAGLGLNVRVLTLLEHLPGDDAAIALASGTLDFGLLWRPRHEPWRIGAQLRLGGKLVPDGSETGTFSERYRVHEAVAPWQLGVGVSHRWTADPERAYNAPLREAKPASDRRYLLLSADVVLSGPVDGAVNLEGFISGAPRRAGVQPTMSFHLGAEGEVLHDRLRARVGTYLEPTRASNNGIGRLHLTGGAELRLVELWVFDLKASFAFDASAGYTNVLFGVGLWH
ncbi:MAG: hypothetical protein EP329_28100 [Deltaproteobacteria bacterium]|nr:MAG: hypothetical protein EP329_28100 [Deltaproteobacteria bacterium]